MDRDTAARALADAYTASRLDSGFTPAPSRALEAGRFMEQWLHDHGFRVLEIHFAQRVVTGLGQEESTIHLEAVPGQQIPPGGGTVQWQGETGEEFGARIGETLKQAGESGPE